MESKKNKDDKAIERYRSGELVNRGIMLGEKGTNKFAALIDPALIGLGENNLPSRLCYIEHKEHHTHIYQADLTPILSQLFYDLRDNRYNELNVKFSSLINSMKLLTAFKNEDDIARAYEGAKDTCDICSVNIIEMLDGLTDAVHRDYDYYIYPNAPHLKNGVLSPTEFDLNSLITLTNGNIQSIFSYILTSFFKRKNELSKDPLIDNYINKLRHSILELFKQTVCPHFPLNGNKVDIQIHGSLYATYYLDKSYSSAELEQYLKYDPRFYSLSNFSDFMKNFTNTEFEYHRKRNYNTINLKVKDVPVSEKSYRWDLARNLFKILQDIDKLNAIKKDLENIKDLNDPEIYRYLSFDKQTCEAL